MKIEAILNFNSFYGKQMTARAVSAGVPEDLARKEPNLRVNDDDRLVLLSYGDGVTPIAIATEEEWREMLLTPPPERAFPKWKEFFYQLNVEVKSPIYIVVRYKYDRIPFYINWDGTFTVMEGYNVPDEVKEIMGEVLVDREFPTFNKREWRRARKQKFLIRHAYPKEND